MAWARSPCWGCVVPWGALTPRQGHQCPPSPGTTPVTPCFPQTPNPILVRDTQLNPQISHIYSAATRDVYTSKTRN